MRIWVVDDKIPLEQLYAGPYPTRLERDLVKELIASHEEHWDEAPVLALCRAVCDGEYEAAFFKAPDAVMAAMTEGIHPPHVVIFDWEYIGSNTDRNIAVLDHILSRTFAHVQVYTHLPHEDIDRKLSDLKARFPSRLLATREKTAVNAAELTKHVKDACKGTIAGDIADKVRALVSAAVENCLIDMCSVKREVLASVADGRAENLIQVVLSKVRDEVGLSGADVFTEILKSGTGVESSAELKKLMSVWYYGFPADNRVRRGDIIEVGGSLGIVVTPSCDLVRFPKKTGTRLTWLRMEPFIKESLDVLSRDTGLEFNDVGGSIVASHGKSGEAIILLPNMPSKTASRENLQDHMILCHSWETMVCTYAEAGPLTYARLPEVKRRCTLAEPFLNAVITRATAVISSPGVPDIPNSEKTRLRAVIGSARPARVPPALPVAAPPAPLPAAPVASPLAQPPTAPAVAAAAAGGISEPARSTPEIVPPAAPDRKPEE
jgi:hypothetical protein